MSVWWLLKVCLGLALVGHATLGAWHLVPLDRWVIVPVPAAQALVLFGAGIHISHYVILKQHVRGSLVQPDSLVTRGGLFSRVRHPMYLGDAVAYAGLAALTGDGIAFGMLLASIVALRAQCGVEDRALARRFGEAFGHWATRTGALIPAV